MPTIITHAAPALALAAGFGSRVIPLRLAFVAVFCAVAPDLDVVGMRLGIAYGDALGHRGMSHSLAVALLVAMTGCAMAPWLRAKRWVAFMVLFAVTASHSIMDGMTSGGLGAALFWPFNEERVFLPWRPIRVSPFSPKAFLSQRGVEIILSELRYVWLQCLLLALGLRFSRNFFSIGASTKG